MKIANVITGTICIVLSIWFYLAISTFSVEKGSDPKRLVIREGIVRDIDEIAAKLSKDSDFDIEGAYRSGYTPYQVVEYLIREPHDYSVTFYEGNYYEGRQTVLYLIPLLACIFLAIGGAGLILFKRKSGKL